MSLNRNSLDLERDSSQYASISDTASLSIVGDITIEAWIKPESLVPAGNNYQLVTKWDTANNDRSYRLYLNSTESLAMEWSNDGSEVVNSISNVAIYSSVPSNWIHVAAALDVSASSAILYINGSSVASTDTGSATSIDNNVSAFAIGADFTLGSASNHYDGLIDEVRIWNGLRTAQQISDNYQKQISPTSTNLVGYWRLNNNYLDETNNNNDLTASGSPVFSTTLPFTGTADSGGFINLI